MLEFMLHSKIDFVASIYEAKLNFQKKSEALHKSKLDFFTLNSDKFNNFKPLYK